MTDHTNAASQPIEKWGRDLNAHAIMFHHAVGEQMGLSATEHKAADMLRRFGAMTAGELAERVGLTTGAVTGLVDRLERAGFVGRQHDQRDRRRVIVQPLIQKEPYREMEGYMTHLKVSMAELLSRYDDHQALIIADFAAHAAQVFGQEIVSIREQDKRAK